MTSSDHEPAPGAAPAGPPASDAPTGEIRLVTTTVHTPRQTAGRHAAPEEAAERGSLAVDDVVVEKVATVAAAEVDHVGGVARRVLGVPTGRDDGDGRPRVSARVTGDVVALDVRLAVTYPASVRATTETVRAHVRDRVQALTELTVTRVDITVAALPAVGARAAQSTNRVV